MVCIFFMNLLCDLMRNNIRQNMQSLISYLSWRREFGWKTFLGIFQLTWTIENWPPAMCIEVTYIFIYEMNLVNITEWDLNLGLGKSELLYRYPKPLSLQGWTIKQL